MGTGTLDTEVLLRGNYLRHFSETQHYWYRYIIQPKWLAMEARECMRDNWVHAGNACVSGPGARESATSMRCRWTHSLSARASNYNVCSYPVLVSVTGLMNNTLQTNLCTTLAFNLVDLPTCSCAIL